jgi:putative ABC transport system permease protein
VLGFREKEVQNYIYKENNILVAAGAIAGLPVGMVLHRYIMREVELTNIMFGRSESMRTFVYAFLLTVLFGLLVNFFMRRKLNRIMMVESLKSVE